MSRERWTKQDTMVTLLALSPFIAVGAIFVAHLISPALAAGIGIALGILVVANL